MFVPGQSGNPTGRKKGQKDRRQLYQAVRDQLHEMGFNPVVAMVTIAMDDANPVQVRRQATKDLLDKTYPDLKAIDLSSDGKAMDELNQLKSEMRELVLMNIKDY